MVETIKSPPPISTKFVIEAKKNSVDESVSLADGQLLHGMCRIRECLLRTEMVAIAAAARSSRVPATSKEPTVAGQKVADNTKREG